MLTIRFWAVVILATTAAAGQALSQAAQQQIQITATVNKACTINGASTGTLDTATIPIDASGNVVTGAITPASAPYANVICNSPSTIQLKSQNGGVKNTASPPSGYTNIIDYQATTTWNSATATIDTSTIPTATGTESGTAQPVSAGSGSLQVTVSPKANTSALVGGTYSDLLTVLLTPQ
jgi:hypothetical protein